MAKAMTPSDICPMELGIHVLSGKWKLGILWNIYQKKTVRFNELQRLLGSVTTKTLTEQLRELEEMKIIERKIYAEVPPKVEYSLSSIEETLEPLLRALCEWGTEYREKIKNT